MKPIISTAALCCALVIGAPAVLAATFQTVHQFRGDDGAMPLGALVLGADGLFYGTTYSGGSGGGGTVFSFDATSDVLTTLHAFSYGGTGGAGPIGALVSGGGSRLYGVNQVGGGTSCHDGCGTIFEINTATHKVTTLYAFSGQDDGAEPSAHLTFNQARTILYGTTQIGGDIVNCQNLGCGTVFQLVLATTTLTTLHQFTFSDDGGAYPDTGLALDPGGLLYGTASARGTNGSGTAFQLDPSSQTYVVLHEFDYDVDGFSPTGDLFLKQGVLYGSTRAGGPTNDADGTLYALDPASQAFATLYSLDGSPDGQNPAGPLAPGKHNVFWGTAEQGGTSGVGTVFSFNTKTMVYHVAYTFTRGLDGALPQAGVILDPAGALYGVTSYQNGTIFKITP